MEDLAVFTALNHSGSFGKNFVKFKKKTFYLPAKGRSVCWKTVTKVLKMLAEAIDLPAGHIYSSACKISENGKRIHSTGGKKLPIKRESEL